MGSEAAINAMIFILLFKDRLLQLSSEVKHLDKL